MSMVKGEICTCSCHTTEGVRHCMPCCAQCPHCHMNIVTFMYDAHVEACEAELKKIREAFRDWPLEITDEQ